jgi:aminoglycoside 6'-N-acetyltransferase
MATDGVLRGERVLLRPTEEVDVEALLALLREPSVARWWGPVEPAMIREEIGASYVIEVAGELAGWLLVYEEEDAMYRHAALDISLATAHQGAGIGPEALRVAIRDLIARGHHRFTIDPAAANTRAISAYASVGFKPVGVLREYERDTDGVGFHDGLLMDLLAAELT